jgi:hypothetical protein
LETTAILLWIAACVLMLIGVLGLLLPALPGAPLFFVGVLLAAWAEDFAYIGTGTLAAVAVLAAVAIAADFVAGAFGARRYGASGRAMLGAAIGAVVGVAFGFVGVLVGPFVGAVLGELSLRRSLAVAGRAGIGATIGLALGTAAKLAIAFAMVGIVVLVRIF